MCSAVRALPLSLSLRIPVAVPIIRVSRYVSSELLQKTIFNAVIKFLPLLLQKVVIGAQARS